MNDEPPPRSEIILVAVRDTLVPNLPCGELSWATLETQREAAQ